MITQKIKK